MTLQMGMLNWRAKQETTKIKAKVKVLKLNPSSLTYVSSKPKQSSQKKI
jgi:hypothetical protein